MNYNWYSKVVPVKLWNEFYSKHGYTYLDGDDKMINIGFLAVIAPDACLEITNQDDLMKIQRHRESLMQYPMPFEKIK